MIAFLMCASRAASIFGGGICQAPAVQNTPNPNNKLSAETSPYLLQHQDNPVDWWPWGEAALAEDLVRACVERSLESAVSNGYLNVTTAAPGEVAVDMSTYDPQFEPDEEGAEEELEELARLVSRWQLSRGEVFVEPSARLPEAPPDLVDVPAGVRSFKFPFDSEGLSCVVRFESASGELLAEASGGSGIVPLGAARASITTASGRPWSGWFKFER